LLLINTAPEPADTAPGTAKIVAPVDSAPETAETVVPHIMILPMNLLRLLLLLRWRINTLFLCITLFFMPIFICLLCCCCCILTCCWFLLLRFFFILLCCLLLPLCCSLLLLLLLFNDYFPVYFSLAETFFRLFILFKYFSSWGFSTGPKKSISVSIQISFDCQ
jgi:hypothetical protein